ncbi:hypothetical protein LCGC14_1877360 [marine sediment metagenome]|uniref:Uncharacterized protein n=1 Tax=marine sediment metagenome TaxID=412755 RepID=A0A0F9IHB3_9ZZZZ
MGEFILSLLLALSMVAGSGQASEVACEIGQLPGEFPPHTTLLCELKTGNAVWITASGVIFVRPSNLLPSPPFPADTY